MPEASQYLLLFPFIFIPITPPKAPPKSERARKISFAPEKKALSDSPRLNKKINNAYESPAREPFKSPALPIFLEIEKPPKKEDKSTTE